MPEIIKPSLATPTAEKGAETQMEKIARENFAKWNQALLAKDAAKVVELYSADNTFLPTLSPEFKGGKDQAKEYFAHFLLKNPEGEIITDKVQELSENTYLHSGLYNFQVGTEDNRQIVEARFSFVWQKDGAGDWKIIHHHSSVKPTK